MSSLLGIQTKTHILDPVFFTPQPSGRCEFRLDPKVSLSNWRLGNLGATVTLGTATNPRYPANVGAGCIIERAYLYVNDNEQIDITRNVKKWLAFRNIRGSNDHSLGLLSSMDKAAWGFSLSSGDENDLSGELSHDSVAPLTNLESTTCKGWLDLRKVFGFLDSNPVVFGDSLQNIRLVLEWVSDLTGNSTFARTTGNLTSWSALRPVLIYDEIVGNASLELLNKNRPQSVQYLSVEEDQIIIEPVTAGTKQVRKRVRGFDSKLVNKLLLINQTDGTNTKFISKNYSLPVKNEQIQLILNGSSLLPWKGLSMDGQDSEALKLAYLVDSWGDINIALGQNYYNVGNANNIYDTDTLAEYIEILSYGGLNVNSRVDELYIEHSRDYTGGTAHDSQITLIILGLVSKQFNYMVQPYGRMSYL